MASTTHDRNTDPSQSPYDTPETVAEKTKNIPVILAMANHYLIAAHEGDYSDCDRCPKGA